MACSRLSPPSLSLTVSLSPFLCTLMYKIAPIHKQHHYFHCLPTVLSFFLLFLFPSPLPLSLFHTHTQTHTHFPFSPKLLSRYIWPGAFIVVMGNIEESRKLWVIYSVDAHNQILQVEKLHMTDSDI